VITVPEAKYQGKDDNAIGKFALHQNLEGGGEATRGPMLQPGFERGSVDFSDILGYFLPEIV
jgi:hypothetical protein